MRRDTIVAHGFAHLDQPSQLRAMAPSSVGRGEVARLPRLRPARQGLGARSAGTPGGPGDRSFVFFFLSFFRLPARDVGWDPAWKKGAGEGVDDFWSRWRARVAADRSSPR